ncbi:MobV family relaxase [Hymenobacter sp. AT01-02]|uniref:MobV family relaxase n=1 Tax=Hymenobacter sp. AT01-02 TaxID=1571877 RepID=UPI0006E2AD4B|nr:MobV family relaxase [Hymenobacter sp. AT01-02]
MPYAVIRVAKIKTQAHALSATGHNYRQEQHPHSIGNADKEAPHPNREYINHEKKDYWSLLEARIQEAGVKRVRSDSVRGMEVILTGSPEGFVRGQDGRAADYSKSKWAQDNLNFLKEQFGAKNIVSFTLHQDEKTPHIHAVLAPITDKNTLSADQLFNPKSLRQLQTEYAQAMAPHGFERGIEHSQAKHDPMQRLYGLEAQHAQRVAELTRPAAPAPAFQLTDPPLLGRDEWKASEEARINAELARQAQAARAQLAEVAKLAQANTAAVEQVRVLQKQLSTSEGLKQGHFGALQTAQQEEVILSRDYDRTAVQYAQGADLPDLKQYGQQVREETRQALVTMLEQTLAKPVKDAADFQAKLKAAGYQAERDEQSKGTILVHEQTGARFKTAEIQPNGQFIGPQLTAAIERTAQQALKQSKGQGRGGGIGM